MRGNRWSSALPPTVPARTGELRLAGGADRRRRAGRFRVLWAGLGRDAVVLAGGGGGAPGRRRAGRFRVLWAGLARDAVVLAGHGGVTAGRRRPGPGEVRPCRGTVKAPGRRQAHGVVVVAELP